MPIVEMAGGHGRACSHPDMFGAAGACSRALPGQLCRNGAHGSPVGTPDLQVGTPDLQVLNGTARPVHGADVAVIVANGRVTGPAVTFAKQQRLHVVDRQTLGVWASGSRPL